MPIVVPVSDGTDPEEDQGGEGRAPPLDPMSYPQDAETKRMNNLSIKMWSRLNAGYIVPTRKIESQSAADFKYNHNLVEQPDRSFFHKRDTFSEYVEAAARMGPAWMNTKPSTGSSSLASSSGNRAAGAAASPPGASASGSGAKKR